MTLKRLAVALCFAAPGVAQAATCEDSFTKSGNPLVGTRYTVVSTVPNVTPASAINQIKAIAPQEKLDVLTADAGTLLLEIPATLTHKAIPLVLSVTAEGGASRMELLVKFDRGAFAGEKTFKSEMCALLAKVQGGKAGAATAAAGARGGAASPPIRMEALGLSLKLAQEAEQKAAAIPLRYAGKTFILSGRADYAIKDGADYRVAFDIPEPNEVLLKGSPGAPAFHTSINCMMAKDQTAYALSLSKGESIKLMGTFLEYSQFKHALWLKDCRPVK